MRTRIDSLLWALLALLTLPTLSCRKPLSVNLGQPFDLHVRQAARLRDSDLDLYFRRVAADSRCPENAQCISAGEATVTLEGRILKGPVEPFDVVLPGGVPAADSIPTRVYDGYRIRLTRLTPHPVAGTAIDTTAYVATLVVEKR